MNVERTPGIRRLVVAVDAEGYSRHRHPVQLGLQARLRTVMRSALARSRLARWRVERQESGDGLLLVLPPGVDEAQSVPGFLRGLLSALASDRATRGDAPALRLRVALVPGTVHRAATGFVGRAVVEVRRLVDADVVKAELQAVRDADACLVVSDELYRDVVVQGYGGFPADGFRTVCVRVVEKDFTTTAWMRATSAAALGPEAATVVAAAAAGSLPFAAAAMVGDRVIESVLGDDRDDVPDDVEVAEHEIDHSWDEHEHDDLLDHHDEFDDGHPTAL